MQTKRFIWLAGLILVCSSTALAQGAFEGNEFALGSDSPTRLLTPVVSFTPGGGFLVIWDTYLEGLTARHFNSGGRPAGAPSMLVAADPLGPIPSHGVYRSPRNPALATFPGGGFLLFWTEDEEEISLDFFFKKSELLAQEVWGQRFSPGGQAVGQPFRVSELDGQFHSKPAVSTAADGNTMVVWQAEGPSGNAILGRLFDRGGKALGEQLRFDAAVAEAAQAAVATRADGLSLVVWRDCCDAAGDPGIWGRLVNASGESASQAFLINDTASGEQIAPAVAVVGDGFLVAWQGPTGELEGGRLVWRIYGRYIGENGGLVGDETLLSSGVGQAQTTPMLAAGPGREVLLTWMAWVGDFREAILGTRVAVTPDGALFTSRALRFSQGPLDGQFRYGLATDGGGRFLPVWAGFDEHGERALEARLMHTTGAAFGACGFATTSGLQVLRPGASPSCPD